MPKNREVQEKINATQLEIQQLNAKSNDVVI